MASELRVNTLKDASGNNSIATSFVAAGGARAYATVNAYQTTTGTTSSFNISSTTDDGTGLWDNAYTSNMSAAPYSVAMIGTGGGDTDYYIRGPHIRAGIHTNSTPSEMLTSGCGFVYRYASASTVGNYGYAFGSFQIFGDLA